MCGRSPPVALFGDFGPVAFVGFGFEFSCPYRREVSVGRFATRGDPGALIPDDECLTGVVDEASALKVGKLAGAQLLVTGRLFIIDDTLYAVSKIISTETSKVKAEVSKGPVSGKFSTVIEKLFRKPRISVNHIRINLTSCSLAILRTYSLPSSLFLFSILTSLR